MSIIIDKPKGKGRDEITIISDLDDVVLETTTHFLEKVNERFNINAVLSELDDPEFNGIAEKYGIPAIELYQFYDTLLHEEEFLTGITDAKDAKQYMNLIKSENYQLYIVSGRPQICRDITVMDLKRREIEYDGLYLTDQEAETNLYSDKVKTKDEMVGKLSQDSRVIIMDDSPRLIKQTLNDVLEGLNASTGIILFEKPWTRHYLRRQNLEDKAENSKQVEFVTTLEGAYESIRNAN